MPNKLVLDANVVKEIIRAEIQCTTPVCVTDLSRIIDESYEIAIDDGDKIETEWRQTCNCNFFNDWITERLKNGTIKVLGGKIDSSLKRILLTQLGFHRKDLIYIWIALETQKKYIISEDMHFYDPKKMSCTSAKQKAIKQCSGGKVANLLKRNGVVVSCIERASSDL